MQLHLKILNVHLVLNLYTCRSFTKMQVNLYLKIQQISDFIKYILTIFEVFVKANLSFLSDNIALHNFDNNRF